MTLTDLAAPHRVAGDTNDTLTVQCGGIDHIPTAATIEAHVWRPAIAGSTTVLPVDVVDADTCTVRVRLGTWIDTAVETTWRLEVQITGTWEDGQTGPRTFPARDGMPLPVRAAGG